VSAVVTPPSDLQLLTFKDVQALLKVARSTVYTLIEKQQLVALKIGGGVRFRASDVRALINGEVRSS
jgi:excisionase family DNA binding protein